MHHNLSVLVTDFDGTITANDFYLLVAERLLSSEALAPWEDYRTGKITHFTALQKIFGQIRAPESTLLEILHDMRPDPQLPEMINRLKAAHWHVVVASAGCEWYIQRILTTMDVHLEVHANPGVYRKGGPLEMHAPLDSPFYSPETGVDKAAIVRFYLEQGATVAYAGDGYTDLPAALLVDPGLRYARGDLAESLHQHGEIFSSFTIWSDIVRALLASGEK